MHFLVRLLFLVTLSIGCLPDVLAQTKEESTKDLPHSRFFNIGMMAGINASSFTDRIDQFGDAQREKYSPFVRFGPAMGLHTSFRLSKLFAARVEVMFNGRGGSYRAESSVISIGGDGGKNYINKNYRLNYFELPVLAEIDFMPNVSKEKLHVRLAAGGSYGYNVASTLRYNGYAPTGSTTGPLVDVEEEFDVVDVKYAKKTVMNAIAELSFDFVSNDGTPMFVKLRYSGSMNGVYDHEKAKLYNFKTNINTWSLMFGFYFMRN